MIFGLGTDLIEVERVASKIKKEMGFRELVFSKNEIRYCEAQTHQFEHFAARFAAKEAFMKALGTGWDKGLSWNEIEILNDVNGKPILSLQGETQKTVSEMGLKNILVSLSHLKTIASAVVIIEK